MLAVLSSNKTVFGSARPEPPRITSVQYCGGSSVLWEDSISTCGGYYQYCGGCSVLWGIASVLWGITSVLRRNSISTAEAVQYSGGIAAVHVGG